MGPLTGALTSCPYRNSTRMLVCDHGSVARYLLVHTQAKRAPESPPPGFRPPLRIVVLKLLRDTRPGADRRSLPEVVKGSNHQGQHQDTVCAGGPVCMPFIQRGGSKVSSRPSQVYEDTREDRVATLANTKHVLDVKRKVRSERATPQPCGPSTLHPLPRLRPRGSTSWTTSGCAETRGSCFR